MTAMGERRGMTKFDREAARRAIDTAHQMVAALCQPRGTVGAREWSMSIPAQRDHDPDLVIADGLEAGKKALFEIDRLRKEVERLSPLEEIAKNGRHAFNDASRVGKTILDFMNFWLDQERGRASRAEAKVEEMVKTLREIGDQAERGLNGGAIVDTRALEDIADIVMTTLSGEIEPGRPAADAPEGDNHVG